jgi:hypothetical protein
MGITVGKSYDLNAAEFFNATQILTPIQKQAVNDLVVDLKNYGVWTKMKAIYPMVGQAGVSSSFEVNLKDTNTFRGIFSGTWIFSSTGAKPNGSTAYMDTGLIPSASIGNYNAHASFYSRTNNAGGVDLGAFQGGGNFYASISYVGTNRNFLQRGDSDGVQYTPTKYTGCFVWNAPNQSLATTYEDGVLKGQNTTTTSQIRPNRSITISAINEGTKSVFSNRECAFTSIGDGLTETEAINLNTAIQRFQTTLGRQV